MSQKNDSNKVVTLVKI